jgi:thiol-disulfide isomerase/thioredoxin
MAANNTMLNKGTNKKTNDTIQSTQIAQQEYISPPISSPSKNIKQGDAAPFFECYDSEGNWLNGSAINNIYKNKYTLVVHFSTTCEYCQHELSELQEVYDKYKNNTEFVIIPISAMEQRSVVAGYFASKGYSMPFYTSMDALSKFATGGVPRAYLINKQGIVILVITGYTKSENSSPSNFNYLRVALHKIFGY